MSGLLVAAAVTTQSRSAAQGPAPSETWREPARKEWPTVGGDWGNTRYSSLTQINASSVSRLGGAWLAKLDGGGARSTPVMKDGRLFVTVGARILALSAKSGEIVWTYQSEAGALSNRGLAVGEGLVFAGQTGGYILAVTQEKGELVWRQKIGDGLPERGQAVPAAPTYAQGLVVGGLANGDFGLRGRVVGLDARTGNERWRFNTIPGPGELGHDTWPKDSDVWLRGGAGVWMTVTVDPDLEMVYFGTGNAVPQWGGEAREGDNLFTASAVAVDLRTGKYRWHFQSVHHDVWDHDLGTPLVLYEVDLGGRRRKGLAAMRTDGYLFLLDRETGTPLLPIEERPVKQDPRIRTARTQPFPVGADQLVPRCVEPDLVPPGFDLDCYFDPFYHDRPNVAAPLLATRASPMAYSPQTGYFYAVASVDPFWLKRSTDPYFFSATKIPGQKRYGIIAALDSRTNKIVWKSRVPYGLAGGSGLSNGSGVMTTAGGLIFHGEPDGNLQARDAKTGTLLWEFQLGSPPGPTSTYEIDGEQYVAVSAGNSIWALKLGGAVPPQPAPASRPAEEPFSGRIERTNEILLAAPARDMGLSGAQLEYLDEYALRPSRIQVDAGTTVTWKNNGTRPHALGARDGSWGTGTIKPGESGSVRFEKPGAYTYVCSEHQWSIGQVIVS